MNPLKTLPISGEEITVALTRSGEDVTADRVELLQEHANRIAGADPALLRGVASVVRERVVAAAIASAKAIVDAPTQEQLDAIGRFAATHGRRWKSLLGDMWATGKDEVQPDAPLLRQVRNQFGPEWLVSYKLPKVTLAARLPTMQGFNLQGSEASNNGGMSGEFSMTSNDRRFLLQAMLSPDEPDHADDERRAICGIAITVSDLSPEGLKRQTVTVSDYEFHGERHGDHLRSLAITGELLDMWRSGAASTPEIAIAKVAPIHKIGDWVVPNGERQQARIVAEDTNYTQGPKVPGETYWNLRFVDGKEGGGWRDGALVATAASVAELSPGP